MPNLIPAILELIERLKADRGGVPQSASGTPDSLDPGSLNFAETVARLVGMPLDDFARRLGRPLHRAGASPQSNLCGRLLRRRGTSGGRNNLFSSRSSPNFRGTI